jgi:TATA-box binding protein (TBP) (component of TFIID and TFIIIB)
MEYPGKCYCTVPCKGNGTGTGNGECKKVTIAIFQSGSLIITGARSLEQIETAYHFINTVFERHHPELRQEKASFIQQSEEKTDIKVKNAIYIKFTNIIDSPFS